MELLSLKSFAKTLNDQTFTDYFLRLSQLAKVTFKWENLPNKIDEKWIEKFLFNHGKCVFYNDKDKGLMIAECTEDNALNNYGEPTTLTPSGINIVSNPLKVGKECVLIRNNDDMIPTAFTVKLFAYRLAEISRTIDINIHAQKMPCFIACTEKQKLTLRNLYAQWDEFEPLIIGDKSMENPDLMKVLKTDAPIVFDKLQNQKIAIWNECLTFLGINNANTEKRERLITDEVEANNDHIELSADCMLRARQKAAEQINDLFGTDITVSIRKRGEKECMQNIQ